MEKKEDSVYRSRRISSRPPATWGERKKSVKTENFHSLYTTHEPTPTRKALVVDLNTADTTTLMLLHGIGPAFARRIVRYRDRLGGFTSADQLLEVYGFTPQLLGHIAPHLRIGDTSLVRMAVNSVGLKQFIRHPYVDYYFARDLVNLRANGVTFDSPDDLRAIPSCSDTMLRRLLPYLDFSPAANPLSPGHDTLQ
ncbi:MAG: helix-hairpin-helix domain-containing protein [Bacteroidales bacterium]|nr:helix-hairpin-helix domain-containing protein [Bacteroidales bacterium]